jgi:hypothetical protein
LNAAQEESQMPVQGREFTDGPFQDVRYLIEQTELLYQSQIIPKGGPDRFQAAADRAIDHRGWRPSFSLFHKNLEPVLRELDIFYVPKQLAPGPAFVFPSYDTKGEPLRAQINPFGWELVINGQRAKYARLGHNYEFKGPMWIGTSDKVLGLLIQKRVAVLVEGPWDVVACRVVGPDVPVISTGTKTMNEWHFLYLKILGVESLIYLFDNEFSTKQAGGIGAGQVAQNRLAKIAAQWGFKTSKLMCPKEDPSACLKSFSTAHALKQALISSTEF